jgi:hypothetical protein
LLDPDYFPGSLKFSVFNYLPMKSLLFARETSLPETDFFPVLK